MFCERACTVTSSMLFFFLLSRYHDKVVSQRSQRNYKIGGLFSKMPQSNRITLRKSCVAFFRANLPNCPVKQLYTLLNQKMFAGNWRVRVPPFSLFFLAKRLPEENQRFYSFFAYGITETLAICSFCFRIHRVGQIVVFFCIRVDWSRFGRSRLIYQRVKTIV